MDVTERLLSTKVVLFLEFLRFALDLCTKIYDWLEKMWLYMVYSVEKVCRVEDYSLEKV